MKTIEFKNLNECANTFGKYNEKKGENIQVIGLNGTFIVTGYHKSRVVLKDGKYVDQKKDDSTQMPPQYQVDGVWYTSTQLVKMYNNGVKLESHKPGESKTFAFLLEQITKMLHNATDDEIKTALKTFQNEDKKRKDEKEKAKAELEKAEKAELARLLKKYKNK